MSELDDVNPYESPEASASASPEGERYGHAVEGRIVLASRWNRLGASIIDSLLSLIIMVPVMIELGFFEGVFDLDADPPQVSVGLQVLAAIIGFGIYLLFHGYLIATSGQTIGKRLFQVRMVRRNGSAAGLSRIVMLRMVPMSIVAYIPFVGPLLNLVDILFIFGRDRRCIHDLIADTVVVQA